jgi:hypothetical protein
MNEKGCRLVRSATFIVLFLFLGVLPLPDIVNQFLLFKLFLLTMSMP